VRRHGSQAQLAVADDDPAQRGDAPEAQQSRRLYEALVHQDAEEAAPGDDGGILAALGAQRDRLVERLGRQPLDYAAARHVRCARASLIPQAPPQDRGS
jgi:hypothetical protein